MTPQYGSPNHNIVVAPLCNEALTHARKIRTALIKGGAKGVCIDTRRGSIRDKFREWIADKMEASIAVGPEGRATIRVYGYHYQDGQMLADEAVETLLHHKGLAA